jgi:hypothetical protein
VERVEILNCELLLERCLVVHWRSSELEGGEDDVINIEQQVNNIGATAVDKQRGV